MGREQKICFFSVLILSLQKGFFQTVRSQVFKDIMQLQMIINCDDPTSVIE